MLSMEQLGESWWGGNQNATADATKRMRLLESHGEIEIRSVLSHPVLQLAQPLVIWSDGQKSADFAKLAYQLANRWPNPHRHTFVATASKRAGNRFGGHGGRVPKRVEMTHDLHVGAVYLTLRQIRPDDASRWISEDEFDARRQKRPGDKLPDAVLDFGDRFHAIEIGGIYDKQKLADFHSWCAASGMSYEIW